MTKEVLLEFPELIKEKKCNLFSGISRTDVDLGIANIVIAVTGESSHPVAGVTAVSEVVKDSIVADLAGAMQTVCCPKAQLEELSGVPLETTTTAAPPGIIGGNVGCIANVVEGAGLEAIYVIDEPTAATSVPGIRNGVVVDIGGGTTGISVLKDGRVIFTTDKPAGGTHVTLVLTGYYGVLVEEVEKLKMDKNRERDVFPITEPAVEKMALIIKGFPSRYEADCVCVVGGASHFGEFEHTFEKALDIETVEMNDAFLVTLLGIARNASAGPV